LALYGLKSLCKYKEHKNNKDNGINKTGFAIDLALAVFWLAASLAWLSPLYLNKLYICNSQSADQIT
ncbi:13841_t:CDS:2, partial [Dentiscutata heterogama]